MNRKQILQDINVILRDFKVGPLCDGDKIEGNISSLMIYNLVTSLANRYDILPASIPTINSWKKVGHIVTWIAKQEK